MVFFAAMRWLEQQQEEVYSRENAVVLSDKILSTLIEYISSHVPSGSSLQLVFPPNTQLEYCYCLGKLITNNVLWRSYSIIDPNQEAGKMEHLDVDDLALNIKMKLFSRPEMALFRLQRLIGCISYQSNDTNDIPTAALQVLITEILNLPHRMGKSKLSQKILRVYIIIMSQLRNIAAEMLDERFSSLSNDAEVCDICQGVIQLEGLTKAQCIHGHQFSMS
jgi:hypothetical protein